MKVGEFIEVMKRFDSDLEVVIPDPEYGFEKATVIYQMARMFVPQDSLGKEVVVIE